MEGGKDRGWRKEEAGGVGAGRKMERKKTEEGLGGSGRDEWRACARKEEGGEEKKRKKMKQSGQIRFGVEGSEQGDYSN